MANEQAPDTTRIPTVSPSERFTPETIAKLDGPLNEARIAADNRGNPYLEGWDVIACANAILGFDGWSSAVLEIEPVGDDLRAQRAVYRATVAVTAGGVTHTDVGTGVTADDRPEAHETAIKGAVTDGLKRAMRQFGAQFGNDLYDKGRTGGGHAEAPQQEREPEPPREQSPAPATPRATTAAAVLTWAWETHRMNKGAVFAACGIDGTNDKAALDALALLGSLAQTRIENHVESVQPAQGARS